MLSFFCPHANSTNILDALKSNLKKLNGLQCNVQQYISYSFNIIYLRKYRTKKLYKWKKYFYRSFLSLHYALDYALKWLNSRHSQIERIFHLLRSTQGTLGFKKSIHDFEASLKLQFLKKLCAMCTVRVISTLVNRVRYLRRNRKNICWQILYMTQTNIVYDPGRSSPMSEHISLANPAPRNYIV